MKDSSVIFTADYTLHNNGQRALHIGQVTLRLVGAKPEGSLLMPDESNVLAERLLSPKDPTLKGLFWIEGGERTIFALRSRLATLPDTVFVLCGFDLKQRRVPAAYRGFYCKSQATSHSGGAPIP
jgi:hypothetical protein